MGPVVDVERLSVDDEDEGLGTVDHDIFRCPGALSTSSPWYGTSKRSRPQAR